MVYIVQTNTHKIIGFFNSFSSARDYLLECASENGFCKVMDGVDVIQGYCAKDGRSVAIYRATVERLNKI